jgi:hypothetical protein
MNLKSYPKKSIKTPLQIQNHEYTKITILCTIILLKIKCLQFNKVVRHYIPLVAKWNLKTPFKQKYRK